MKRLFTYITCALLAVTAGCNKTGLPESGVMSFCATDAGVTKVVSPVQPDGSSWLIAPGKTIGVYGTVVREGRDNLEVFEKQAVTCNDDLEWTYSPLKYWKNSGDYYFKAVYPYSADCQSGTDGQRLLIRHAINTSHYDLMVASATRNPATQGTAPVNLKFKHACSAVRFLIKKASADYNYSLTSFELQNLRIVGTLGITDDNLTLDSWHTSGMAPAATLFPWSAATAADRRNIPTSYEDYEADWYYMIPQSIAVPEGSARPAVKFSVIFNAEPTPVVTTLPLPDSYEEGGETVPAVWEPGKVYNYYINLQPSRLVINVTVTDWDEQTLVVDDIIF